MKTYDPKLHHRRSIRLKGYDYSSPGYYYITLCVNGFLCLFGEVHRKKMLLNEAGEMIDSEWQKIPERFNTVRLHHYIVMPNHFHAILEIRKQVVSHASIDTNTIPLPGKENTRTSPTLGRIIGAFESITTVNYCRSVESNNWPRFNGKLWLRNYWEHIIRCEKAYQNIADYIMDNPSKWAADKLNPLNLKGRPYIRTRKDLPCNYELLWVD